MTRLLAITLAAALVSACGDDATAETSGTCDWTGLSSGNLARKCLEQSGPAASIANQRDACAETQGLWSQSACPAAEREGCCTYHFGLDFRECWYTKDPPRTYDPEFACTAGPGTGNVWTPN